MAMQISDITSQQTTVIYEDITDLLKLASKQLNDTLPLINSSEFSLFEAMSAVEIMDPKMDPCYGIKGTKFEEMITSRITSSLTYQDILIIIRELFCREVAYLDGASLLESVNQCIYIWPQSWKAVEDQGECPSRVLLNYVKSVIATITLVHQSVLTADIFEDEDYQASSIISAIFDGESFIQINTFLISVLNDQSGMYVGIGDEILLLLRVRLHFLELMKLIQTMIRDCIAFSKNSSSGPDDQPGLLNDFKLNLSRVKIQSTNLVKLFTQLQTEADLTLDATAHSTLLEKSFTGDILKINQNSPARCFPYLSYSDAIGFVISILNQFIVLSQDFENIISLSSQDLDSDYLMSYYSNISALSSKFSSGPGTCSPAKGSTSVLPRSFLWGLSHFFRQLIPKFVFNSMKSRGIPTHLLDLDLARQWRDIIGNILWDTFRNLCVHRYRLTSRLEQLFERYGSMVSDGFLLDRTAENAQLNSPDTLANKEVKIEWFVTWAIHLTSGVMDSYMELLMEMNLLSYAELPCYYWYWDYLISTKAWAVRTLREMRDASGMQEFTNAQEIITKYELQQKQQKSLKKGKHAAPIQEPLIDKEIMKQAKKVLQRRPPPNHQIESEEYLLTSRSQIAKGLLRVYLSGVEDQMITHHDEIQKIAFNSAETQFNTRYQFFQTIASPTPLRYSQYLTLVENIKGLQRNSKELLETAVKCFKSVKDLTERAAQCVASNQSETRECSTLTEREKLELQMNSNLLKISVALSVNCMRRLQSLNNPHQGGWNLSLDRTHSLCFPVFNAAPKE